MATGLLRLSWSSWATTPVHGHWWRRLTPTNRVILTPILTGSTAVKFCSFLFGGSPKKKFWMLLFGNLTKYKWEIEQKQFLRKENNLLYRAGRVRDLCSPGYGYLHGNQPVFSSDKTQLFGGGGGGEIFIFCWHSSNSPPLPPKEILVQIELTFKLNLYAFYLQTKGHVVWNKLKLLVVILLQREHFFSPSVAFM